MNFLSRLLAWFTTQRAAHREAERLEGLDWSICILAVSRAQTAEERMETIDKLWSQGIPKWMIVSACDRVKLPPEEAVALRIYREYEREAG